MLSILNLSCNSYGLDFIHLSLKPRVVFPIIFVNSGDYGCLVVYLRYLAVTEMLNY